MNQALSNAPVRRMNGGRALAEMLKAHGAGVMFGMGGFQLLPFYEAARALNLRHYLINDERCGAFAADAFARVSGQTGLCDATLGPGATNLITGLVESLNGGVPQVVLVGNTHRSHSWKNMTQECRQSEVLRPAVKEIIRIEDGNRIPEHVRRAFEVATSGRPGPVVLDVPEDVCHGEYTYPESELTGRPLTSTYPSRRCRPAAEDLRRAAALLSRARRPLILAGGGVHLSQACQALETLAREQAIPVAHTMSGKGAIACTDPLSAGLFGRYSRIANDLIARADCLLVVGCKLGEIATKRFALLPPEVPLIHLEVVAEEIGRTTRPDVALWGDAREGLQDLAAELADAAAATRAARKEYLDEVVNRMAGWRRDAEHRLTSGERPINMARLVHQLNLAMPAQSVLVADGGFAAHWTGLLYDTKAAGRTYLADRGFASIGYGLPGGMGASLAAPEWPVVSVAGDGGTNMVIGELETARRLGAAFTMIVVNNAASGYVKALQHAMYGSGNYQSSDLSEIDYAAVARGFGAQGIRVEDPDKLAPAIAAGIGERTRPTVIDVVVTRDPARMLPAVDSRTLTVTAGDRPV